MKIRLSQFAEDDLQISIDHYNSQKENLGFEFINEVDNTFKRIKENYKQFPIIYKNVRKANINRFPFNIFFIIESTQVFILGIFHSSRNPKEMKRRN
jgi:hypothetical protein